MNTQYPNSILLARTPSTTVTSDKKVSASVAAHAALIEDNRPQALQRMQIVNDGDQRDRKFPIQRIEDDDLPGSQQIQEEAPRDNPAVYPNRDDERKLGAELLRHLNQRVETALIIIEHFRILPTVSGRAAEKAYRMADKALNDMRNSIENSPEIVAGLDAAHRVENASDQDMDLVLPQLAKVAFAEESLLMSYRSLVEEASTIAHIAVESGSPETVVEIMKAADACNQELNREGAHAIIGQADQAVRGRRRDKVSSVIDVADTLNNISGVGSGIAGIVEVAGVAGASGGAVAAGIFGGLGMLFGAIGTILAIYGLITGYMQSGRLKKIAPGISSDEMKDALSYAQDQTDLSNKRKYALAAAGGIAIGAGVLTVVAITVATLGVAAVIAGIAAAVIGLGFVGWKWLHRKSKRKGERQAFANAMVDALADPTNPHYAEYRGIVSSKNLNPDHATGSAEQQQALREKLADEIKDIVKSKRQKYAEGILQALVSGTPSQQFEAELIMKALKRDPEKARERVANDDAATEVARIMGKLSSW